MTPGPITKIVTDKVTALATSKTSSATITIAAGEKLNVLVGTDATGRTVTSVVFDSGAQALALKTAKNSLNSACRAELWELVAPSTGTGTITVTVSSSGLFAFIAWAVPNTAAGAGYTDATVTAAQTSTTPSISVTSAVGDLAIGCFVNKNTNSTATADASPVSEIAVVTSGSAAGTSHVRVWLLQETGAASTSPSGTYGGSRDWAAIGVNYNASTTSSRSLRHIRQQMQRGARNKARKVSRAWVVTLERGLARNATPAAGSGNGPYVTPPGTGLNRFHLRDRRRRNQLRRFV